MPLLLSSISQWCVARVTARRGGQCGSAAVLVRGELGEGAVRADIVLECGAEGGGQQRQAG